MITGRRVVVIFWTIGGALITAGIAAWTVPGAMITAGLLLIAGPAVFVNIDERPSRRDPTTLRRIPPDRPGAPPPRMFPAPDQKAK